MEIMDVYDRAQDDIESVLGKIAPEQWDTPSACVGWTVRDIAGHSIWAQRQLRAWAADEEFTDRSGAPGSPKPGVLADGDPLATWRTTRARCRQALTDAALAKTIEMPAIGAIPIAGIVKLLMTDQAAHAWDIGRSIGLEIRLDPAVVTVAYEWARSFTLMRTPAFFGPALDPPAGVDEQARMLAFIGRQAWEPAG